MPRTPKIDHRAIARSADDLAAVLAEAVDELQEVTRREAALDHGTNENRDQLAANYPALEQGRRR